MRTKEMRETGSSSTIRGGESGTTDTNSGPIINDTMLRYMLHYLDLVYCDDVFMVLNMLFDSRLQSKFHIIVGAFREKYDDQRFRAPYLVRTILEYAHGKVLKPCGEEHTERESCLRSGRDNFANVRELYGLKAYDEMLWPDPDEV